MIFILMCLYELLGGNLFDASRSGGLGTIPITVNIGSQYEDHGTSGQFVLTITTEETDWEINLERQPVINIIAVYS